MGEQQPRQLSARISADPRYCRPHGRRRLLAGRLRLRFDLCADGLHVNQWIPSIDAVSANANFLF
jgi:hypothetical protein